MLLKAQLRRAALVRIFERSDSLSLIASDGSVRRFSGASADLTRVVYPATATTLSRIGTGDCSTVVSALAISARKPVLLVPAMNEDMLRSVSAQRNLAQLREDGFFIAHPSLGYEVATAPGDRQSTFGGAPPVAAVADMVEAIVVEATQN